MQPNHSSTPFWKKVFPYIVFLLIFVALYWSFDWAMGALVHARKVVMVPDLQGKTLLEATQVLKSANLGLIKEGEQYDKQAAPGTIVFQAPPSGMKVREGRIVRVFISQGGMTFYIPDVIGQTLQQAQTTLQNAGFGLGEVQRKPSLRYAKDEVITTDPAPGSPAEKNMFVQFVVSAGPPASNVVLVPDFVGQNFLEAKKWATSHSMPLTVREEPDNDATSGEVLSQFPVFDSPMRPGDALTVVVNSSKRQSSVGGLNRMQIQYEIPAGGADKNIRVYIVNASGSREVYHQSHPAGRIIQIPIETHSHGKARIFSNGILVKEVEIQ